SLPVPAPDQHDRKIADLARLDEGQALEQFVERPEATRHDDERVGVLHEHRLAGKEVLELDAQIDIGIEALLVGQLDVAADRQTATLATAAVGSLHDPRAAAGDDRKAALGKAPGNPAGELVVRRLDARPRRSEDRDRGPDRGQRVEALDELAQDAE